MFKVTNTINNLNVHQQKKWKNQLWYIHRVKNYLALKNEWFRTVVGKPWPVGQI